MSDETTPTTPTTLPPSTVTDVTDEETVTPRNNNKVNEQFDVVKWLVLEDPAIVTALTDNDKQDLDTLKDIHRKTQAEVLKTLQFADSVDLKPAAAGMSLLYDAFIKFEQAVVLGRVGFNKLKEAHEAAKQKEESGGAVIPN